MLLEELEADLGLAVERSGAFEEDLLARFRRGDFGGSEAVL